MSTARVWVVGIIVSLVIGSVTAMATGSVVAGLGASFFYGPLVVNAIVDFRHRLLITSYTHLSGIVAIAQLIAFPNAPVVAAGMVITVILPLYVLAKKTSGLGMGDVRLLAVLILWHAPAGVPAAVSMVVGAVIIQGVLSVGALLTRRASLTSALPFGPALVAASIAVTLVS